MLNPTDSLDNAVLKLFAIAERFERTPLAEELSDAVLDIQDAAVALNIELDSLSDFTDEEIEAWKNGTIAA